MMPYEPHKWIQTYINHSYFFTESGESWTPIGQNDAITWPDLQGLFLNKDPKHVEQYFKILHQHGVTCMRLMMEYCHTEHRYLEKPVGQFHPHMIALWDALFALASKYEIRFLLTPFDTFWMKRRWKVHPYNKRNGGVCSTTTQWLLSKEMRTAIKNRFEYFTQRWGGSGIIFAWDLWNEIHPVHARQEVGQLSHYVEDVGGFLRNREIELFGKAHLQTVSFYGTSLLKDHRIAAMALHHPGLDFATIHFYDEPEIDRPKNTIDAAIVTGSLTREVLAEINDERPFFDTEHGPIFSFNNKGRTFDEAFDDEYFHNMQWAHFASGGAGGGMRWPYRNPHTLTVGMRKRQLALSGFVRLVDWKGFKRNSLNEKITVSHSHAVHFSCGDEQQAIVWLLRNKINGAELENLVIDFKGKYAVVFWDTMAGNKIKEEIINEPDRGCILPSFEKDVAVYLKRI